MSKYCIRLDRPMPSSVSGEQILTGCNIYGVHHNCEGCPNLKEMGDETYFVSSISEESNLLQQTSIMSKRAEEAALKAYPEKIIEHVEEPGFVVKRDLNRFDRNVYIKGYEQAEKDIWAAIVKQLSKRDARDYSTIGWILKHLDEYKKAIMKEE